ncbi:MAG: SH3 domain-containing protein [Treponema sp.]|nr:SH3 domain-containing protein [Treponema sp.]
MSAGVLLLFSACSGRLGWGVLLWSSEEPAVLAGTVLPVYIRSNIDKVWVVGVPAANRIEGGPDKFEVPLAHLELAGSKKKAAARAEAMAEYARTYAENLQDGLPIREQPDNGARRVYRLRISEIIKVLAKTAGNSAVGASGDPLPGDWYQVMTEDGTAGYCFSYRLKFFEHDGGPLAVETEEQGEKEDPELDRLLARTWSAESYLTMVNTGRFDLGELSRHWGFSPGQDTGIAHIYVSNLDRTFPYTGIRAMGSRVWRFEGTNLQMSLRSDTTLTLQFTEAGGALRSLNFVALAVDVEDLIVQENGRREELFRGVYEQGPVFISNNYGTLALTAEGAFTWTGNRLLIPQVIPTLAQQGGSVAMDLYLGPDLQQRYQGAFSLRFDGTSTPVRFMYTLDAQGLRIEYAPDTSMDHNMVARRASSPTVIYFYRAGF